MARALRLHRRGHRFDSDILHLKRSSKLKVQSSKLTEDWRLKKKFLKILKLSLKVAADKQAAEWLDG